MELYLSENDVLILHRVIEAYLDVVRSAFGRGEPGERAMLAEVEEALGRILGQLHAGAKVG